MRCIRGVSALLLYHALERAVFPFLTFSSSSCLALTLVCACVAIWTGLSRNLDEEGEAAIRKTSKVWKDLDQGCATTLVAALDPALDGTLCDDEAHGG